MIFEAADDLKNSRSYYLGNNQLFKVDDNSPRLLQTDADIFHNHVARLKFASNRARPDIQVSVVFLCKQIKSPTEQDYKKLGRVISVPLPLVICVDDSRTLTWNIDASFRINLDSRSHTGACLTLGHGSVFFYICKTEDQY